MSEILIKIKANRKDIIERVMWTFIQAFLGGLSIDVATINGGVEVWKAALIAAAAAGLSAVKNVIIAAISDNYR